MPLKTNYKNISWEGLRKYQLIENQDGTVSFLDVTEYLNTQDAQVLANDLNTNNDTVNRIMNGEYFYFENETDALLAQKQNLLTFDDTPTANSDNPVKSGGIKSAIDTVNTRIDNLKVFSIHVCGAGEYDPATGQPTIQNPDISTFYLVPSGTTPDVFTEWVYVNNSWELFGSAQVDLSNYVTISDLNTALEDKQDVLTFDDNPTQNSDNPVKSGGIKTALDGKSNIGHTHDDRYYTETEMDTLLAGKSDIGHTHDDRYYTESEMDTLLAGKSDSDVTYTKTEVDTLLSAKSDNTHDHDGRYYTESEVDTLLSGKQDTLTFDNAPTQNSNNPVKSGGIYSALGGKQDTLTFDNVPTQNSDNPVKSGGVYNSIADLQNQINNINNFSIHVCSSGEYDPTTGQPTIQNPEENVFYLVPSGSGNDVYAEWIYVNRAWEKFGITTVDLTNYVTISALNTALAGKQDTLTFDNAPTSGSDNPVKSGGVYSALAGKQDTLTFDNAPTADSSNPVKSGGVYSALAGKQDTLTFDNAPTVDSSNPVKSGGVYSALQTKADSADLGDLAGKDKVDWDTDIDDIPATFPPSAHNHDDRYYTESEVNSLLAGKQNALILPLQTNLGGTGQAGVDTTPTTDSLKMVTSGGVKTALDGKVSISGDTMTGDLKIKHSTLDSTQTQTSDLLRYLRFCDKNNVSLSLVYGGMISDDRSVLALRNQLNGVTNSIYLLVKRDGTKQVQVDDKTAWRNALGASSGIWPTSIGGTGGSDTGWQSITNSDVFTGTIYYRKIGAFVTITTYNIKLVTALTTSGSAVTLCRMPNEIRPNIAIHTFTWNASNQGMVVIYTSRDLQFNCGVNQGWAVTKGISFNFSFIAN